MIGGGKEVECDALFKPSEYWVHLHVKDDTLKEIYMCLFSK